MSTLVLLRHAQAMFGAANYDTLSAHGRRQALSCGDFWRSRGTAFSKVVVGPRERHRLTAELALAEVTAPLIETDIALDEFGEASALLAAAEIRTGLRLSLDAGLTRGVLLRHYVDQINLWACDDRSMDGVESVSTFRRRIADWLDATLASTPSGQKVLAVTSGGTIAAVMAEILGLSNAQMVEILWAVENCSMTAFAWSHRGRALRYFNQTAHLPAELLSTM